MQGGSPEAERPSAETISGWNTGTLWAVTLLPIHSAVIIMEPSTLNWHGVRFPPE